MSSKPLFLWPRHEALHLVTPALSQGGRNLSNGAIIDVARQLFKVQTTDGLISFEQWLIVAKDLLKWNDWCIRLFWDMLQMAIHVHREHDLIKDDFVEIGHLVIFLALHQINTSSRPTSPTKMLDTYWPSPERAEEDGSLSPVSPRKKLSQRPSSPKPRISHLQIKHTRSSNYHLHVLKEKMVLILRLLGGLESGFLDSEGSSILSRSGSLDEIEGMVSPRANNSTLGSMEVTFSKKSLDSLSLVIGVGETRIAEESHFTNILPYWSKIGEDDMAGSSGMLNNPSDQEDFDFDRLSSPTFKGFPQPVSSFFSSSHGPSGSMLINGASDSNTFSSPPTPPSKLQKTKSGNAGVDQKSNSDPFSTADFMKKMQQQTKNTQGISSMLYTFTCSELSIWIESHLTINEIIYPSISAAGIVAPNSTGQVVGGNSPRQYDEEWVSSVSTAQVNNSKFFNADTLSSDFGNACDDFNHNPVCSYISMLTLKSWQPFVISRRQNVLIHVITPQAVQKKSTIDSDIIEISEQSKGNNGFGLSNLSLGAENNLMINTAAEENRGMEDTNDGYLTFEDGDDVKSNVSRPFCKIDTDVSNKEIVLSSTKQMDLSPLYVQSCLGTCIYLLGAYSFASISSCTSCDIVIGAVNGVVRLIGCERVKLTVSCTKLIVVSCIDCVINVACLKPTVLVGENKALVIGPHNVNYRLLKSHLIFAGLKSLTIPAAASSSAHTKFSHSTNCWNVIHDVCTLLDSPVTVSSPTGYAVDAAESSNNPPPPHPSDLIAKIMHPDQYLYLTVPVKSESRSFEVGTPIEIPPHYYRSLVNRKKKLAILQQNVIETTLGVTSDVGSSLQSALSHRFLEWLVKSGKAQQVMDLIRLDENSAISNESKM